jgi:HJR/Mrr/RecB family endonuclease
MSATVLFHVVADAWNDLGSYVEGQPDWDDAHQTLEILAIQEPRLVAALPAPAIHIPQLIISAQSRLIEAVRRYPSALFSITPREFEEIVAEVFLQKGFEVTLTQATRDGGRDIIALHETMGIRSKLLIECKRYAPERKVGIAVVQRLYGVKVAEGATKALVATTSSFSKDARVFAQQRLWELDLKGYDDVIGWIRDHGARR